MKARALVATLALTLGACRATAPEPTAPPYEVRLEFAGEHALDEPHLSAIVLAELARTEKLAPSKADIDDAAFALEVAYRAHGFPFVRVDYELSEPAEGPPCARFTIDEGPRTLVRELRLSGLTSLDPQRARAEFGAAAAGGPYDADLIAAGVSALRQIYLETGYLRVSIAEPVVAFDAAQEQAEVSIAVSEGPLFRLRELVFEGGLPEFAERELALRGQLVEKVYHPELELELQSNLREAYVGRGYADADIQVVDALDLTNGDARLSVHILPGERVTIAEVRASGNVRTRLSAIQSLLGIEPGDVYDPEAVREGFRELYATGLFESLKIELEGTGPSRALLVDVVEARFVQIRMEPGWGSYEGPRALLAIDENNFRGLGQRVSLEGTVSPLAQAAHLRWIDPRFLDTRYTAEMTFFVEQREEPSFSFNRIGAGFFLRRRWSDIWSTSFGYEIRPTNVTDDLAQTQPSDITDDADVAELSTGVILDDRDNPLLPTRGQRAGARLEWADEALGSQVNFLRGQLEYARLIGLGEQNVLASSARTGVIAPHGTTDEIPLPERFFNGGENTVRSFQEDELGPVDPVTGEPIGGEAATTLSLELRRLLTGNLAAALFADAGNVTVEWQDYLDFHDFRYALGVGLRYLLPIGPLRVDLAVNPDPNDGEDDYALHFSVGFPF